MTYKAARQHIKSGDLIAFRGDGFFSRLIRHVTGGRHTHVGIAWRFRGRVFVLEAHEKSGVQLRALSECLPFDWISCGLNWTDDVESFALSQLGKPYSYSDAVRAGLGARLSSKGLICSEYVTQVQARMDARLSALTSPTPTEIVHRWIDLGAPLRSVKSAKSRR